MRKISIRTLLALSTGGLVLVATMTVLVIALQASSTNTFELLNQRVTLVLDGIETEVRNKLDGASAVVDGLALQAAEVDLATDAGQWTDTMKVVLATSPEIEVLLYWDRNLVRHGVARAAAGRIVTIPVLIESDSRLRNDLAALEPGEPPTWGDPVNENGITYVNVVTRLATPRSDIAFIGAAVSLEHFSRFVAEIGERYGATAFMLYGEQHLLAHPGIVSEGDRGRLRRGIIPRSEANDPVIANLDNGTESGRLAVTAREQGVQVRRVEAAGAEYVVMYRWLFGYGPQPIAVGAYYPSREFADTVQRLLMSGIAGLVVVVLSVIAAIVIGGFIARPIRRLAGTAAAVARLDLASVEPAQSSPIAEVHDQAHAFNMMLDGLRVFETYVPRQLVQRLIAIGNHRQMASQSRELTVMFTDIARFTEIAERMGAEETAEFLNRHFGILADCITREGGTIDKYIGDAVMAFWGAPDRMDDHAARAVAAARAIAAAITADNRRRAHKGLKPVRVRIGLHSGPAVVGNIGAPGRVNYTIVGPTVNVAQRLESLGHMLDAGEDVTILMSAQTAELAAVGDAGEAMGAFRLAGVPHEVEVVRLRSADAPHPQSTGTVLVPARI